MIKPDSKDKKIKPDDFRLSTDQSLFSLAEESIQLVDIVPFASKILKRQSSHNRIVHLIYIEIGNFPLFKRMYGDEISKYILFTGFNHVRTRLLEHIRDEGMFVLKLYNTDSFICLCSSENIGRSSIHDFCYLFRNEIQELLNSQMVREIGHEIVIKVGHTAINIPSKSGTPEIPADRILREAIQASHRSFDLEQLSLTKEFKDILEAKDINIHYQPILDLQNGTVFGWEALSRGPAGGYFQNPKILFDFAEEIGSIFLLEQICREKAIVHLGKRLANQKLFLNIHPRTLVDPRFSSGQTMHIVEQSGFRPDNIVFEITERHSIRDFTLFYRTLDHYRKQGYLVAVDDVGTGYSGLHSIAELRPEFIKIDMLFIRNIDRNPVNRALLETFITFAEKIGSKIISEGIETETELSTVMGLGSHLGQGYFLARPEYPKPMPRAILPNELISTDELRSSGVSIPIKNLLEAAPQIAATTKIKDVKAMLDKQETITGVVVVEDGQPVGLVMSHHLNRHLGTIYGVSLYFEKDITHLMDSTPLIVDDKTTVEMVGQRAMNREKFKIYDDIIVTSEGRFTGIVSVQKVLDILSKLHLEMARGANPLTGLPGNVSIDQEIERRLAMHKPICFVYADLDNFKVYNDTYGFKNGDGIILLLAHILLWACKRHGSPQDFIGHLGGDDFIFITSPAQAERVCKAVVRTFKRLIPGSYSPEDRVKGCIVAKGRDGIQNSFPLVSVSLAIVDTTGPISLSDLYRRGSEMKNYAKSIPGNVYVRDRRSSLGGNHPVEFT